MSSNIPNISEVANRIQALREDLEITSEQMAEATGLSVEEYLQYETGEEDITFSILYKIANRLGVDIIELLTGETPHLKSYSLVRANQGLSVKRREGFEYLHIAPNFDDKLCEPFVVRAAYREEEQDQPIRMEKHDGQEFEYILSGHAKFEYRGHVEYLNPGDAVLFDSGYGHGLIATGGEDCTFLAIVMNSTSIC